MPRNLTLIDFFQIQEKANSYPLYFFSSLPSQDPKIVTKFCFGTGFEFSQGFFRSEKFFSSSLFCLSHFQISLLVDDIDDDNDGDVDNDHNSVDADEDSFVGQHLVRPGIKLGRIRKHKKEDWTIFCSVPFTKNQEPENLIMKMKTSINLWSSTTLILKAVGKDRCLSHN